MNKVYVKKNELTHYGVKGMKWGVRKDRVKERISRTRKLRNRRIMSDEELRKSLNRLQMEKQYRKLAAEDLAPAQTAVANLLGKIGTTALMAAAGSVGAKLAKEYIKNKIGG